MTNRSYGHTVCPNCDDYRITVEDAQAVLDLNKKISPPTAPRPEQIEDGVLVPRELLFYLLEYAPKGLMNESELKFSEEFKAELRALQSTTQPATKSEPQCKHCAAGDKPIGGFHEYHDDDAMAIDRVECRANRPDAPAGEGK